MSSVIQDPGLTPRKLARLTQVDYYPWETVGAILRQNLKPGKHVAIIAKTGDGKTTLCVDGLLPYYEDVLIIDSTADPNPPLAGYGEPVRRFGKIEGHQRLELKDMSGKSRQKLWHYLTKAHDQGNIAVYIDELRHLTERRYFNLTSQLEYLWLFGRKRGVTIIGASQAPRFLPSAFYDQSKNHILFRTRDRRTLRRMSEIGGDVDTIEYFLPQLEEHEFLYVTPKGELYRSKYRLLKRYPEYRPPEKERNDLVLKHRLLNSSRRSARV
jgi:hypothetical protein